MEMLRSFGITSTDTGRFQPLPKAVRLTVSPNSVLVIHGGVNNMWEVSNDYRKKCYKLSKKVAEAMTLEQLKEFVADEIYYEMKKCISTKYLDEEMYVD
jgi:hypothetical protein